MTTRLDVIAFAMLAMLLTSLTGCESVRITALAVANADTPVAEKTEILGRWCAALALANDFLASPFRHTLPPGRFEATESGLILITAQGSWPIEILCTTWGNLVVWTGFAAQEREWGFVVGEREPDHDPVTDNSLFRHADGSVHEPATMAKLILHETTHMVYREGTVGFWNSVAYYLEAIFLLRSAHHSAERRPHATSEEFGYFFFVRTAGAEEAAMFETLFAEHLASGKGHCEHGPFDEPPPVAPRAEPTWTPEPASR